MSDRIKKSSCSLGLEITSHKTITKCIARGIYTSHLFAHGVPILKNKDEQPDQINNAVFSGTLYKVTLVYVYCKVAYTGQVTFYKVPETYGHF